MLERKTISPFHRWEAEDYTPQYLQLVSRYSDDANQTYRFVFKAVGRGEDTVVLRQFRQTAFITEPVGDYKIRVSILEPKTVTGPQDFSVAASAPDLELDVNTSSRGNSNEGSPEGSLQKDIVAEVEALLDLERFSAARKIINEQINETQDSVKKKWLEKLAGSYFMAGDYEAAIDQWRRLIEEFPDGNRAGWLLSMAEAYRKINEDDQAQLLLMRIRFRHRQSSIWPQAMRELAVIATERDEYEHAREVLEEVVSVYDANRYPETVLELARLYDHQPILRDYSRAVGYYREAAAVLEKKKPEQAKKARRRADYLIENYIDFGTE